MLCHTISLDWHCPSIVPAYQQRKRRLPLKLARKFPERHAASKCSLIQCLSWLGQSEALLRFMCRWFFVAALSSVPARDKFTAQASIIMSQRRDRDCMVEPNLQLGFHGSEIQGWLKALPTWSLSRSFNLVRMCEKYHGRGCLSSFPFLCRPCARRVYILHRLHQIR